MVELTNAKTFNIDSFKECRRLMIVMAIPVFFELLLQMIMTYIDQYMVSSYSPISVAAIGNAEQILFLLLATNSMLCNAMVVLISQYKGAGDIKKEKEVYVLAFWLNLLIGSLISVGILIFQIPIFKFMNLDQNVMLEASTYISIVGGSFLIPILISTFNAFFSGNGMMSIVMYVSVGTNIANVIGNYILIFGRWGFPELGIQGAALSTAISRFLGLGILIYFYYKKIGHSLSLKYLISFPVDLLKKLLYIGGPSALEPLVFNITQVILLSFINGLGLVSTNTYVYVVMFSRFTVLHTNAMKRSSQIIVGMLCGSKRKEDAQNLALSAARISALMTFFICIGLYLVSDGVFSLFTDNPAVFALGSSVLLIDIIRGAGRAYNLILVSTLQAVGEVIIPTTVAIISGFLITVWGGHILGIQLGMGLVGIYAAITINEWTRAIISAIQWRIGKWKEKNLIGV